MTNFSKSLAVGAGALAAALGLCFVILAWNEPGSPPPAGNVAAPINTGATAQTKVGDLNLGGKLSVASDSASGRFCLDGQCCSSWPECTAFGGGVGGKLTPMSDVSVAGYDKYKCIDPAEIFGFTIPFLTTKHDYWCPPDNCVMASQSSNFLFFFLLWDTSVRRMCAESGYELFVEDENQYDTTDKCTPDGGAALSNFTEGLYVCDNGTWVKTSN